MRGPAGIGSRAMDPKPRPNHREYIKALRRMTPEQRLKTAMELSDWTKRIFKDGLRKTFPQLSDEQLHRIYLERLARCHNRNY